MRKLNFKQIGLAIFLLFCSVNAFSQTRYDERVDRYKTRWEALIPSYTKVQFAGSMGLISVGTGWDYGRNNQWETDLLVGFVPKYTTDHNKITFTLKQNFIPWRVPLKNRHLVFEPLTTGLYINTVTGGEFWVNEPDKYPSSYYSFSTKLRVNVFLGQRFTYNLNADKRRFFKSVTGFYEVSTNELYMISAFQNKYLKLTDIMHLSLGIKFQIL